MSPDLAQLPIRYAHLSSYRVTYSFPLPASCSETPMAGPLAPDMKGSRHCQPHACSSNYMEQAVSPARKPPGAIAFGGMGVRNAAPVSGVAEISLGFFPGRIYDRQHFRDHARREGGSRPCAVSRAGDSPSRRRPARAPLRRAEAATGRRHPARSFPGADIRPVRPFVAP